MHEQRCARKRAFCEQNELNVVAMCCSSAQHERFLLFLCRPLCVALRESPPGTLSKNRWSNGLYDRLEEWLPTNDGRFVHFDLLLRRQPLDASFCITLSRSRLDSSSSSQMTTVHPIPVSSPRYPLHQEGSVFRSSLTAPLPFLS